MAKFLAVFMAFVLNCVGIYIFTDPIESTSEWAPLLSSVIFALGVSVILLRSRIYPSYLKKLHWFPAFLFGLIMSAFILEHAVNYFWFPLEYNFLSMIPIVVKMVYEILCYVHLNFAIVTEFLRLISSRRAQVFFSYLLSVVFTMCALHATRVVDFRCDTRYYVCKYFERMRKPSQPVLKKCSSSSSSRSRSPSKKRSRKFDKDCC